MRLKVGTEGFKGTSLSTLLVVSLMVLAISLLSVGPSSAAPEGLTPRAPIYIYGNGNFTLANGVTSGSGTVDDPYIIENWAIDALTAHGIHIENTTASFIVRNCLVENGRDSSYYGIYLGNVIDGKIENNTCSGNNCGIFLEYSSNNTVSINTCSNNSFGIGLGASSNNTLSNNTCSNNDHPRIYLT